MITVGTRFPAHATSMGRVLLAGLPRGRAGRYLASAPSSSRSPPRTITDRPRCARSSSGCAAQGCALVDEELEGGLRSARPPVCDREGSVVAAVDLSVSARRTTLGRSRRICPLATGDRPPDLARPRRPHSVTAPPGSRARWTVLAPAAALVLAALCLRGPFSAVGPVLDELGAELSVSTGALAVVTSLPLVCFGLVSPVRPGARRPARPAPRGAGRDGGHRSPASRCGWPAWWGCSSAPSSSPPASPWSTCWLPAARPRRVRQPQRRRRRRGDRRRWRSRPPSAPAWRSRWPTLTGSALVGLTLWGVPVLVAARRARRCWPGPGPSGRRRRRRRAAGPRSCATGWPCAVMVFFGLQSLSFYAMLTWLARRLESDAGVSAVARRRRCSPSPPCSARRCRWSSRRWPPAGPARPRGWSPRPCPVAVAHRRAARGAGRRPGAVGAPLRAGHRRRVPAGDDPGAGAQPRRRADRPALGGGAERGLPDRRDRAARRRAAARGDRQLARRASLLLLGVLVAQLAVGLAAARPRLVGADA